MVFNAKLNKFKLITLIIIFILLHNFNLANYEN